VRNPDVIVMIYCKTGHRPVICRAAILFTRCSTASLVSIFFILRPNNIIGFLPSGRAMLYIIYILDALLFLQNHFLPQKTRRAVSFLKIISSALERTTQKTHSLSVSIYLWQPGSDVTSFHGN
jgi:hypothetical protein